MVKIYSVILISFPLIFCFPKVASAYRVDWYVSRKYGIRFMIPGNWLKSTPNKFSRTALTIRNGVGAVATLTVDEKKSDFNYSVWQNKLNKNIIKRKFRKISKTSIKLTGTINATVTNYNYKKKNLTSINFINSKFAYIFMFVCDTTSKNIDNTAMKAACEKSKKNFINFVQRIVLFK
ncbi:MAG: hypothetical protein JXR95_11500 [Deltaproteobacteria bacterium]|nr:hypothetical protein [Deltaproteobacteria bacterium]